MLQDVGSLLHSSSLPLPCNPTPPADSPYRMVFLLWLSCLKRRWSCSICSEVTAGGEREVRGHAGTHRGRPVTAAHG